MHQRLELQNITRIKIEIAGRVSQSDIIGAVFGQTEQVLVESLDLRKLQKEGKLGRIEVETEYNNDGTIGIITIPSNMDKTNTVIIAAAMETIEKIGPCKATAKVEEIVNIKEIKVGEIVEHAKEVLKRFMDVSVDSQELIDNLNNEVRVSQATTYGEEGVPCGPKIDNYEDVFFVETVDELNNLLKNGIKNVVAFEDMSKSKTLHEIASKKEVTVIVDKGKEHVVRRLLEFADIDSYTTPEGYEKVKEMNSKELYKIIRNYVSAEQLIARNREFNNRSYHERPRVHNNINNNKFNISEKKEERKDQGRDSGRDNFNRRSQNPSQNTNPNMVRNDQRSPQRGNQQGFQRRDESRNRDNRGGYREFQQRDHSRDNLQQSFVPEHISSVLKSKRGELSEGESLVLDNNFNALGRLPSSELVSTLGSLENIKAVVVNGAIDSNLVYTAEKRNVEFLCGNSSERTSRRVKIVC